MSKEQEDSSDVIGSGPDTHYFKLIGNGEVGIISNGGFKHVLDINKYRPKKDSDKYKYFDNMALSPDMRQAILWLIEDFDSNVSVSCEGEGVVRVEVLNDPEEVLIDGVIFSTGAESTSSTGTIGLITGAKYMSATSSAVGPVFGIPSTGAEPRIITSSTFAGILSEAIPDMTKAPISDETGCNGDNSEDDYSYYEKDL